MSVPRTRRHALMMMATAAAGTMLSRSTTASVVSPEEGWVDAHSHIWTSDVAHFPLRNAAPATDLKPPSFTDEELMQVAGPEGVRRAVLIQHFPYHGWDNSYVLDAVRRHPNTFRVVGMIDDALPHADQRMHQLLPQGVTGFRIGPREGQTAWLESDGMRLMWKTAAETRQAMCCLINPQDVPAVDAMCTKWPETPVVIDHFARIGMTGPVNDSDLRNLCRLSRFEHVRVKISAYYALGRKKPPYDDLVPMIRRLFEEFGAERLMWASDSPYQLQDGNTYKASIALVRDHLDFVTPTERGRLLRDTATNTFFFS